MIQKSILCTMCLEVLQDFIRHDTGQVPSLVPIEEALNYNSVIHALFSPKGSCFEELKRTSNKNRT